MKFDFRPRIALIVGVIVSLCHVVGAQAAVILPPLNAIQDTWTTPLTAGNANTTAHNGQLINVRGGGTNSGSLPSTTRQYGIVEFDLSGITAPIIGATLQLYMLPDTASAANNGNTTAIAIGLPILDHIDEETLSHNGTNGVTTRADMIAAEVVMQDLGRFTFNGPVTTGEYYSSLPATEADWGFLEAKRTSAFPYVAFLLNQNATSSSLWHQWADRESGFAPQLVLTVVPEPSAVILAVFGVAWCAFGLRRKLSK